MTPAHGQSDRLYGYKAGRTVAAMAAMYWQILHEPAEGTMTAAIHEHSQACSTVADAFNVQPDEVASAVREQAAANAMLRDHNAGNAS